MLGKFVAIIELWVGLGFLAALLGFIPVVGSVVAGVISSIVVAISQIPFYGIIMAVLGSILFIDGLMKLLH